MTTISFILTILGSLGVFLFGMKVMSGGIQKIAGDRMRKIMASMTRNRFKGALTGLVTTGLLQSSSATTVMVVSFVSAGLLTLVESIGVIMGANLGTTLTAWIIAAVGKFSISKVALPIIGIGMPMIFISKGRARDIGEALVGFGLLFMGLALLKESVPNMKELIASGNETAVAIRDFVQGIGGHGILSVLAFLFIGVVLTLIVQSSSAAMAITVTFALNGWIGFEDSAAIVLGENIGTTVTAWLASLGANTNAKRAARAHFLFNILGVAWMLCVFFLFTKFVLVIGDMLPASFRTEKHDSDIGFDLAIFHSLFNLLNILILIGFVPLIAKIVTKWVKDPDESENQRLRFLSSNLVDIGELNLPEAENAIRAMAELTDDMLGGFVQVFRNPDRDLGAEVSRLKKLEDEADVLTYDITDYLVRCSAAELSDHNARAVTRMLRMVSELEEISDRAFRLIRVTEKKYAKGRDFTDEATKDVLEFSEEVHGMIRLYNENLFRDVGNPSRDRAIAAKKKVTLLTKSGNKSVMNRIASGEHSSKTELLSMEINNQLEMIGNHARNVLENAYFLSNPDQGSEKYDDV